MDVTLLSTMISELITDHDMVGLPGLGTFVAEVVPATFSDKGYTINPPYRRLSFHPSRSEDTLLIDFYAASNGISKEAAALYLKQFLAEMKTVLKERKTIALPGLGRLRATVENNFFFVPDPDLDIYPDGFGLEPLSLKTITEPEPVEIPLVPQSRETVSAAVADTATAVVAETAPVTEATPAAEIESATAATAVLASTATLTLPTEASAVRTGLKSCAPEGVVRTERSEDGVPCAPDSILRTEVPLVRTGAEAEAAPESGTSTGAEAEPETREDAGAETEIRTAADSIVPAAEPAAATQPQTQPAAEPAAATQPQTQPAVEPELQQAQAVSEPQPTAESSVEPTAEPQPQPVTQSVSEPHLQPKPQPTAEPQPRHTSQRRFRWWVPVLILLAVAAVALLAFLTVAQVAPDFVDSILYTPEELRIINY